MPLGACDCIDICLDIAHTTKKYIYKIACDSLLLNIKYCTKHGNIFIASVLITAHSHLYGVNGGGRQLFVEPWRVIEFTASAIRATPSSIPELGMIK